MRNPGDDARRAQRTRLEEFAATNGHTQRDGKAKRSPAPGPAGGEDSGKDRPVILVTTKVHVVNDMAVSALAREPNLYQRAGDLVRVVCDEGGPGDAARRRAGPRIVPVPQATLREILTRCADFRREKGRGNERYRISALPPDFTVSGVHAKGVWPGIPYLDGVVAYPVLREDGTVLAQLGYDRATELVLTFKGDLPAVPDRPTRDEAKAAVAELLELVQDFPFKTPAHASAWLASVLTPLARPAYHGPAPLFLFDANAAGSGKTLLALLTGCILTGATFPVSAYTHDPEEMRKRIFSLALAGARHVLLDNVEGRFGNHALDLALTGTTYSDRLMATNTMKEVPLQATFYATGNNVTVAGDIVRRCCHIRLESPLEHPEERKGFAHPDLIAYAKENRTRLLRAALVILRAYCVAGRPDQGLEAWGTYDGWTALVRSALVWAGQPDPLETRQGLRELAEVNAPHLVAVMNAIEALDLEERGVPAATILDAVNTLPIGMDKEQQSELKTALTTLLPKQDGRCLGDLLRANKRRIIEGRFIDQAPTKFRGAVRWIVLPQEKFSP